MRFAFVLCLAAAAAVAADESTGVREVAAATEQLRAAMMHGDRAGLDRILHPDLSYEHSSALTQTKAEMIAATIKPGGVPKGVDFHDGVTHIYGETALYKGKVDITNSGGEVSHLDVLMVWLKTPSGWRLIARHSTKVQ